MEELSTFECAKEIDEAIQAENIVYKTKLSFKDIDFELEKPNAADMRWAENILRNQWRI